MLATIFNVITLIVCIPTGIYTVFTLGSAFKEKLSRGKVSESIFLDKIDYYSDRDVLCGSLDNEESKNCDVEIVDNIMLRWRKDRTIDSIRIKNFKERFSIPLSIPINSKNGRFILTVDELGA